MKKTRVRCWGVSNLRPDVRRVDSLWIAYPEDNTGHRLISCLNCGHVYAVDVAQMVYVGPPLEEQLRRLNCVTCDRRLSETCAPYPESYVLNGEIVQFERPMKIPPDAESFIKDFDGIY